MTKLAHQILDDDRVLISFVGRMTAFRVAASEARRFAWALLADLDPAEADSLGYTPPAIIMNGRGEPFDGGRRWGAWQQREILAAIRDGAETSPQIALSVHVGVNHAAAQLSKLSKRGHVYQLARGTPYRPGKWTITAEGLKELAILEAQSS